MQINGYYLYIFTHAGTGKNNEQVSVLLHKEKFSPAEFAELYNNAYDKIMQELKFDRDFAEMHSITDYLVKHNGFIYIQNLKPEVQVYSETGEFPKIIPTMPFNISDNSFTFEKK